MSDMTKKDDTYEMAVARRKFLKRAVVGAVLAAPVITSLTKSDILVKSALAASTPEPQYFTVFVTIERIEDGTGTIDPAGAEIKVPKGGSRMFTVTPASGSYIQQLDQDGPNTGPFYTTQYVTFTDNGSPTRTLYVRWALA